MTSTPDGVLVPPTGVEAGYWKVAASSFDDTTSRGDTRRCGEFIACRNAVVVLVVVGGGSCD